MYGRWKSSSASAFVRSMAFSTISAFEPTHIASAHDSHFQIGSGVPQ